MEHERATPYHEPDANGVYCSEVLIWHPATDLPDTDTTVVCWWNGDVFTGWWDSEHDTWRDATSIPVTAPTHWASPAGPPS